MKYVTITASNVLQNKGKQGVQVRVQPLPSFIIVHAYRSSALVDDCMYAAKGYCRWSALPTCLYAVLLGLLSIHKHGPRLLVFHALCIVCT